MNDVPPDLQAGATIGEVLAWHRKRRDLTGKELAARAGVSQSKISRIENGIAAAPPSPKDVETLVRHLEIDEPMAQQLIDEAIRLREPLADWSEGPATLVVRQQNTEQVESTARNFKIFQPAVVVGLLQTDDYAKAILSSLQALMPKEEPITAEAAVQEAVASRVHRQAVLLDPRKRFELVMSEAALNNRVCPPEIMLAQIRRLREAGRRRNIVVGIIPAEVEWPIPPFHGFTLLDDRDLFVDLYDTGLQKHDVSDARFYLRVFEMMMNAAVTGSTFDELLDHYHRKYLDLSRLAD